MIFPARVPLVTWLVVTISLWAPAYGVQKRSRTVWYREKEQHQGANLIDSELVQLHQQRDPDHFKQVLQTLLLPRVVGTNNHRKVREHIVSSMRDLSWDVQEDSFQDSTPFGEKTFTNIIATLDPEAPRRLVLACHYDSKYEKDYDFVGATDSSVPCAMMINLAYVLQKQLNQHRLKRYDLTLQLIFFDGEEAFVRWSAKDSLYGSRQMAAKLEQTPYPANNNIGTNELHRIDLFVLLDLIGTKNPTFHNYFQQTSDWYMRMASFDRRFKDLGLISKRGTSFNLNDAFNYGIEDDHIPFLRRNVPILHMIPLPFPTVWHKRGDNESALDYTTINNLSVVLTAFVADYLHLVVNL